MGNMSYCRFENTALDLQDCLDAIERDDLGEMSNREQMAFVNLVQKCKIIHYEFEDMDVDDLRKFINDKNHDDEYDY